MQSNLKVTPEIVREIRRKRREGAKLASLGLEYGLSEAQVCRICSGKAWASVPRAEDAA